MGIMDSQLLFGESIDLGSTSAGATVLSTNNVYIPKVKDHKGSSVADSPNNGGGLFLNMVVEDEALDASGGSATVTCKLMHYTAAITASNLASAGTAISKAITVDASAANYPDGAQIMCIPLPAGQLNPYLACAFTVATKKVIAGKVTAWIGPPTQLGQ